MGVYVKLRAQALKMFEEEKLKKSQQQQNKAHISQDTMLYLQRQSAIEVAKSKGINKLLKEKKDRERRLKVNCMLRIFRK